MSEHVAVHSYSEKAEHWKDDISRQHEKQQDDARSLASHEEQWNQQAEIGDVVRETERQAHERAAHCKEDRRCDNVTQENPAEHPMLVSEIVDVEVRPLLKVPREDQPRSQIIDAGQEDSDNQDQEIGSLEKIPQLPPDLPEGSKIENHKQAEQRGQPADLELVPLLERIAEARKDLRDREPE